MLNISGTHHLVLGATQLHGAALIGASLGTAEVADADKVDGQHYSDISSEIDGDITTHAGDDDAHHTFPVPSEGLNVLFHILK